METITEEIIAKAKADNPGKELHLIKNEFGEAIFQVPPADVWDTYWDMLMNTETRGAAFKQLVFGSVVFPARDQLVKQVAARPGIVLTFADKLVELAGNKRATEVKKL